MVNDFILSFSKDASLVIESPVDIADLTKHEFVNIKIVIKDLAFRVIYFGDISLGIKAFCTHLEKVLQGDDVIDPDIAAQGIGFYHNLGRYDGPVEDYIKREVKIKKFRIWQTLQGDHIYETWVYNDSKKNSIVCTITELFKFDAENPEESKKQYSVFMNDVVKEEYITLLIDHKIAQKWLKKCQGLLDLMEKNELNIKRGIEPVVYDPEILEERRKNSNKKKGISRKSI